KPHLRRTSSAAMLDKVEALLTVGGKHWNYAHAMARRMFGKDKVEYLDDTQLHKLVAALQIAENRKTEKAGGDDGVRKS
ncbi:TPA: phage protein GemA/Gp16 family protein, partial [Neisseria meningitidis]